MVLSKLRWNGEGENDRSSAAERQSLPYLVIDSPEKVSSPFN